MVKLGKGKSIVIATALTTLFSATGAYAATTSSSSVSLHSQKHFGTYDGAVKGGFKSHLDTLVTSGTITQDQEDAIQSALAEAMKSNEGKKDLKKGAGNGFQTVMDDLVSSGTITSDEKTAIQSALTDTFKSKTRHKTLKNGNSRFKTILDELVTEGTISQTQEDAILSK